MGSLSQEEINKDLFDEVIRLKEENKNLKTEKENLIDSLSWVVEQFELRLSSKPATNVVESLSYAYSLLRKFHDDYKDK
ncbi:hypothetical protein [Bacillus velezensis]|uniref:hypothetical protein n=1 Tax=Bacillus velezensis TaxID=492670 RepID=UPI001F390C58|nr:hypothetical protein [Bacillus velezensis]MCP9020133.1 hypothetical protein [Bacillus velezensis]WGK55075.1 hypothetical protein PO847_09690 [Bacillus velezensis]